MFIIQDTAKQLVMVAAVVVIIIIINDLREILIIQDLLNSEHYFWKMLIK